MCSLICAVSLVSLSAVSGPDAVAFQSAKPVWPEGRELEKNLFVGFRAVVEAPADRAALLRITGATLYRVFVNGDFLGHGPARGPHGFYRVDTWDLSPRLKPGRNVVAIEVAGYNANSYYVLDQPSFLQAEVISGAEALAATGVSGFEARVLEARVQKVQRYSFQRPFIEVYRLHPGFDAWRSDPDAPFEALSCALSETKRLLPRRVPYTTFDIRPALRSVSRGTVDPNAKVKRLWKDRSLVNIGPALGGYPEAELALVCSNELQRVQNAAIEAEDKALEPGAALTLDTNQFHVVDLGQNLSGFPRLQVQCAEPVRLYVTFDETIGDLDVNWRRLGCVNAVLYELAPGTYDLEAFEPYTLRCLKLIALEGGCTVSGIGLRLYENPDTARAVFEASNPRLRDLFEAGRTTFAQNAVDIFMDCPHRERAGWLCDSFFTARSAMALSGNTLVEQNFVENFLLPERFAHLPEGMLPMCYPADHHDGVFIPNWALWFVVELGEYLERSGDRATIDALQPKVLALFRYFDRFQNEDGLLEKLESWVFVEWSKANSFVQDVNYPSNMLYAGALDTAGKLYDLPALCEEAGRIREVIRKQSFDGTFFVDNALRKDAKLEVTRNRSEVCQYFAFFFGVASLETHGELWEMLRDQFGPDRKETKAYAEVHLANSFIGNMLRMELLSRYGRCQQILDESIGYLYYMVERTGTLWENVGDNASLNHGFASHIVHTLYRDVLGLYRIDPVQRKVWLRFGDVTLPWCKGRIPVGEAEIGLAWEVDGDTLRYCLDLPEGFTVEVENRSGKELERDCS